MTGVKSEREYFYTWEDFNILRNISNIHSGIVASDDKFDMFYSRLSKRLRYYNFTSYKDYCVFLTKYPERELMHFVNALTTNLTSFYREQHHFEFLESTAIEQAIQRNRRTKTLTAWSAGCSSGEEAYSIAMTVLNYLPKYWELRILATDIDTHMLKSASEGVYMRERVEGLSDNVLKKWFKKGKGKNLNKVKINETCRNTVHFKHLNLINTWPIKYKFDFIFCRNVFIYFDKKTKQDLVSRFEHKLIKEGHFFIGHSESLHQFDTAFTCVGSTIYQKNN